MRNLAKYTNYYNHKEALKDWERLANNTIHFYGGNNLVEALKPPEYAGWRTIDKCIAKLRKELHINPDCPDCEGYGVMHLTNGEDKACDCTWHEEDR